LGSTELAINTDNEFNSLFKIIYAGLSPVSQANILGMQVSITQREASAHKII
jgi:hypothetical protein